MAGAGAIAGAIKNARAAVGWNLGANNGPSDGPRTGLRDGGAPRMTGSGTVPGSGSGDKIPAEYEPGEFVVSNAMLEADPDLRSELHTLRNNVLHAQGKNVADVDDKVARGGLRAAAGGSWEYDPTKLPGAQNGQTQAAVAGAGPQNTGGATGGWGGQPAVPAQRSPDPLRGFLDPVTGVFPGSRAVGRGFTEDASAALQAPTAAAKIGGLVHAAGKATLAAPFGLAEDIIEPATRMLQPLTSGAVNVANTAVTGNSAPLISDAAPSLRSPAPATPAPAATNSVANIPGQDATMPGQDPGRVTLRGQAGTDVGGGITKFVQNGKPLYSNVAGADNDKLMSNNPGISIVPGMDPALIKSTLTNPDGSRWTEGDNAAMAANLRDGQDAYRGTSRDTSQSGAGGDPGIGNFGHNSWVRQHAAEQANQTTLRGQDIQREVAMAPMRYAQHQKQIAGQLFQQSGGDHAKAASIAEGMGLSDLAKSFRDADTTKIANTGAVATQGQTARDALHKRIAEEFSSSNSDPKAAEAENAANFGNLAQQMSFTTSNHVAELRAAGKNAEADRVQKGGPGALDAGQQAQMFQWAHNKQLIDSSRGVLPGSATVNPTNDLSKYRIIGRDPGGNGFKTAGGFYLPDSNAQYGANAHTWIPNMGAPNMSVAGQIAPGAGQH